MKEYNLEVLENESMCEWRNRLAGYKNELEDEIHEIRMEIRSEMRKNGMTYEEAKPIIYEKTKELSEMVENICVTVSANTPADIPMPW